MQLMYNKTIMHQLQRVSIVLFCFLLTACFATPQTKQLIQNHLTLPQGIEHKQTPFYSQKKYQCGPAALATALDSANLHRPLKEIISRVYLPGRKGSLKSDLISATRRYGLVAYQLNPTLRDLLTELAAGNVVIVFQNLGVKYIPRWHFAVAIGYNLENKTIILRSGKNRRRITKLKLFERTWKRSGYWAMVVTRATKIPKTATPATWLVALSMFETDSNNIAKVKQAYRIALKHWPRNSLLHLTSANFWFKTKSYQQAGKYYQKAVHLNPKNGDAWNNFAHLMLIQKRYRQARHHSRKAIQAGGLNIKTYQRTLHKIQLKLR